MRLADLPRLPSVAEVKAQLPIPYVMHRAGLDFESGPDGKVHALCPFHDDSKPSFDVWSTDSPWDRWGCYPCGIGGDVLDFIQRLGRADGVNSALRVADQLLAGAADWTAPEVSAEPATLDLAEAGGIVASAMASDLLGLRNMLEARGAPFTAEQLRASWGVGSVGNQVIVPFWNGDGQLVTYKYRHVEGKPYSAKGGKHTALYGAWRDRPDLPVFLCEGETDCWSASYYLRGRVSVLGLPAGAGTQPAPFVANLKDRVVILAFDADNAGQLAVERWATNLPSHQVLSLPAGRDVWDVGADLPGLIAWVP